MPGVVGATTKGKGVRLNWLSGKRGLGDPAGQNASRRKRAARALQMHHGRQAHQWRRLGHWWRRWREARAVCFCGAGTRSCFDRWWKGNR